MAIDSILYRAGNGFAGDLTRPASPFTAEPNVTSTDIPFGSAAVLDSGKVRAIAGGDTAVFGIVVRPYPIQGQTYPNQAVGVGSIKSGAIADVLKAGYVNVKVQGATAPAKGGAVYVRTVDGGAGLPVGGFEAAADGTDSFVVTGALFNGTVDASGVAEIAYNI